MARPINNSTSALLDDQVLRPALLVELWLQGQPLRLTSAQKDIIWSGNTYVSNGWLLPIEGIQESTEIGRYGFDLTLSGVNVALLSLILNNNNKGELGIINLALFDDNGALVGAPIVLYKGNIDSCQIDDKFENPSILIHLENEMSRFDTSQNYRFTAESHASYYSDDLGFQYVSKLENWSGFWGKQERPKWIKKPKQTKK